MADSRKINVLGTEYDFKMSKSNEDARLIENSGVCDFYSKEIAVLDEFVENDQNSIRDFDEFKKMNIRHELIHAMLFESGLEEYANNELLVSWISIQFPKMLSTFQEAKAL